MDKQCSTCNEVKDIEAFSFKRAGKKQRQSVCKDCQRVTSKQCYNSDKKRYINKAVERNRSNIEWFRTLKDNKPCADCKVAYRYFAMQFDHLGESPKLDSVSYLVRRGKKKVLEEMAKCELVCANCHSYRTHNRFISE